MLLNMSDFSGMGLKVDEYHTKQFLTDLSFNSDEKSKCENKKIVRRMTYDDPIWGPGDVKYYHCPNKEELNKFISMSDPNNCIHFNYISKQTYNYVKNRYYLE